MNTNETLSRNKKLALTGAFSALVIVLGITRLGFISLSPTASITILHIPVFLVAMLAGLPYSVFVGAIFGIFSLIQAAMNPSGILDPVFINPLCSVLPRMIVAVISWGIWKLLNLIPRMPKAVSAGINGFISSFCHTLIVIGCWFIFEGKVVREGMGGAGYFGVIGSLAFNSVLESIASTIVCAAVFAGIFISKNRKSKLSQEQ